MKKEEFLYKKIEELIEKGSDKKDLENLSANIEEIFQNIDKRDPEDVIKTISQQIVEQSQSFMSKKNEFDESLLSSLSTCIYLPTLNGEYKVKFLSGKTSDGFDVNDDTLFDIASITKMFTLLLTFKLVEYSFFNLDDKIAQLDNRFTGLEDFTVQDILLLCGTLYTNGSIADGKSVEDANEILETVYLKSNDRSTNLYTDLGAIVLSKVIEKVVSEKEQRELHYDEIVNKYLLKPFGLNQTKFNPENYNLAGNGNKEGLVHDPKAQVLGGAVGSAGIFTNADDLVLLAHEMFRVNYVNYNYLNNLISKTNLIKMGSITFPNSKQNNKGLLGGYQKNSDRENKWLNPLLFADNTFTFQGFTGATATFDFKNQIHNSFLVGSIKDNMPKKPDGFLGAFKIYQRFIVGKTLELYLVKQYFDLYNKNNTVNQTIKF